MNFRSRRGSESDLSYQGLRKRDAEKIDKSEKKRKKSYHGRTSLPSGNKSRKHSKVSKVAVWDGLDGLDEAMFYEDVDQEKSLRPAASLRLPTSPSTGSVLDYRCLSSVREKSSRPHALIALVEPQELQETRQEDPEVARRRQFYQEVKKTLDDMKRRKNKRTEHMEVVGSCETRGETKAYIMTDANVTMRMGDVLWLQLQAYLAGRSMKTELQRKKSINDHDAFIIKERKRLEGVLDDIRTFRFDMNEHLATTFNDRDSWFRTLSNDCYMHHIRNGRKTVDALLTRFDEYWSLFPRFKAMFPKRDGDLGQWEANRETMERLELLYMWYNTFDSLRSAMKTVGDILQHRSATASSSNPRSPRSSSDNFHFWPKDDCHSPSQSWSTVSQSEVKAALLGGEALLKTPELDEKNDSEEYEKFLIERFRQFYRDVVQQSLQLRGMREVLNQIDWFTRRPLDKAVTALVPKRLYAHVLSGNDLYSQCSYAEHKKQQQQLHSDHVSLEHKHFKQMNLPSFYPFLQFLITVPVDLVEQWCAAKSVRRECKGGKRDLLTINTLIEECHECLVAAIDVKLQYVSFVKGTCVDPSKHLKYLTGLDRELIKIFLKYFEYLHEWADSGSDFSCNDMEWSNATQTVDKLISEWTLTKKWTISIPSAESDAAISFCHISKRLLNDLVLKFLQTEVEKIDRIGVEEIESSGEAEEMNENDSFEMVDENVERKNSATHSLVFMQCRRIKLLVQNLRQRSLKALAFLKAVSNDLEFCAKYKVKLDAEINGKFIVNRLLDSGFVILRFKHPDLPFFAFCPTEMGSNSDLVNSLLNCICSRCSQTVESKSKREPLAMESMSIENEGSLDPFNLDTLSTAIYQASVENAPRGFMVILSKMLFDASDYDAKRETLRCVMETSVRDIEIRSSTAISLTSSVTVGENEIYLVAETRCSIPACRKIFENVFSKRPDRMELSHDFCSLYDFLEDKLDDARDKVVEICNEIWSYVKDINNAVGNGIMEDKDNEIRSLHDALLHSYNLAFQFTREVCRLIPASGGADFAEQLVNYVEQWEEFLQDTISKQQPIATTLYSEAAFNCIMMGYKKYAKFLSTEKVLRLEQSIQHLLQINKEGSTGTASGWSGHSRHPSRSTSSTDKFSNFSAADMVRPVKPADRIAMECAKLDNSRNYKLLNERRIGHITEYRRTPLRYCKTELKAPFKWQCFEKCLGRGQQGSVHVVFDSDNDRLLAMKRVQMQYNDEEQVKRLVLEVENLRNLDHINLVKYYGVEIKNECMMIFMEYCHEGTLERVCRERLDLSYVRRYTKQLLSAVECIHSHNIVHRDIKPANIFLTRQDVLKLGDFGCSLRLTSGSTIVGEIQEHIGTACYMAPEIATRGGEITVGESSGNDPGKVLYFGYGRAVDIWSTGCVVLEMLTGRRPYDHLMSDFQIYYALGTGKLPEIPLGLNELTMNFLNKCLVANPLLRATAHDLLADAFANIQLE